MKAIIAEAKYNTSIMDHRYFQHHYFSVLDGLKLSTVPVGG